MDLFGDRCLTQLCEVILAPCEVILAPNVILCGEVLTLMENLTGCTLAWNPKPKRRPVAAGGKRSLGCWAAVVEISTHAPSAAFLEAVDLVSDLASQPNS